MDKRPFRVVRWLKRSQRGQVLIEFALGAPLLLIMLLGLVEFGHGLNSYLTIVASARDSARLGAQEGVSDVALPKLQAVVAKQTERLENTIDTSTNCGGGSMYVCIESCQPVGAPAGTGTSTCTGNPKDKWMSVEVCYDHPTITGVPLIPNPIHMCSSTTIRIAK